MDVGKIAAGPAVIVGPYGHTLARGHEGQVVATIHGHAVRKPPVDRFDFFPPKTHLENQDG